MYIVSKPLTCTVVGGTRELLNLSPLSLSLSATPVIDDFGLPKMTFTVLHSKRVDFFKTLHAISSNILCVYVLAQ